MNAQRSQSGLTAGELLFVVVLVTIAVAVIWPRTFSGHHRARVAVCDNVYVALNGEVANELDSVLNGATNACGSTSGNTEVMNCTLAHHRDEDNPRNRKQTAYTTADQVDGNGTSCQVGLLPVSTNGIRFHQYVQQSSANSRTFSVVIDSFD